MFLGIDIGTGSSKAVIVAADGSLAAAASRQHRTSSPQPGWFEHDAETVWWDDVKALIRDLHGVVPDVRIEAICVSGIGPCTLIADEDGTPLRPAILYGIDRRAGQEIDDLTASLGADTLLELTGNRLTTQAVGPKVLWLAQHEPDLYARARRWYCASNFLVGRLTGQYVIDHYSASTSDPLYDLTRLDWWPEAWTQAAPGIERPRLAWPGEIVGSVGMAAAQERAHPSWRGPSTPWPRLTARAVATLATPW
jgi:xylulokinase